MDADETMWSQRVEAALLNGDGPALRSLYAEALVIYGDGANQRWAQALSAFDSSAVTG